MNEQTRLMKKNVITFYRATGEFGFLSNLYPVSVNFEGRFFPTAEHAYQFGKFRDLEVAEWVMKAPHPHLVAIVGHGLFAWDITDNWAQKKVERMKKIVLAKFVQHIDLKNKLIETDNAKLIENSTMDNFWGCGPKGKGKNMLGRILMEIREKFQNEKMIEDEENQEYLEIRDRIEEGFRDFHIVSEKTLSEHFTE